MFGGAKDEREGTEEHASTFVFGVSDRATGEIGR